MDWALGRGVEMLRYSPTTKGPAWTADDSVARDEPALIEYMRSKSRQYSRPMLLQARLVNHPTIGGLGNGALCTLRMMTLHARDMNPEFFRGFLRIARGASAADNFHQGSLVSPIDTETGKLGRALSKLGEQFKDPDATNPETGAVIAGTLVPYWTEAMRLVLMAHGALGLRVPLIGWDVAVLEDGPILIEGNGLPCHQIPQKPTGTPLGQTPLARIIRESLEAEFAIHPTGGARPPAEQKLPAA